MVTLRGAGLTPGASSVPLLPRLEVTASPTRNSLARDSTTSPTAPPSSGLPNSNVGDVRLPLVHAAAHIGVHRHEEVANQHLPVLQRLQFGPHQRKVSRGRDPLGAGCQPNLATREF